MLNVIQYARLSKYHLKINHQNEVLVMIKKLTKHGNSMALVIDKSVLDLLKIENDTPLEVSTDGNVLIISPVRDETRATRFKEALERTNRKYSGALKRLAQ
jgi:antitoxin component of MazEF toxin-antitoxin module